jgi:hypothetical protein
MNRNVGLDCCTHASSVALFEVFQDFGFDVGAVLFQRFVAGPECVAVALLLVNLGKSLLESIAAFVVKFFLLAHRDYFSPSLNLLFCMYA